MTAPLVSQTAEYAFRALAELARLPRGAALRVVDLAERTGVPAQYLAKVLRRLHARGLLRGRRGRGGGFRLARPPSHVRFVDVLSALDEAPVRGRCAFGWSRCDAASPCPLHPAWVELNQSFVAWAASKTLGDVNGGKEEAP